VEEDVPPGKLDAAILRRSTLAAWCEKTNFVRRQPPLWLPELFLQRLDPKTVCR